MIRPMLPWKHQNSRIKDLFAKDLPPVKYQLLDRDGQQVLVGRMKIPTPSGHAFILRRFDTNAISLTTMFRAAFPGATDAEERNETAYVKDNHELLGNNGSTREPHIIRLAGTWVDPVLAVRFAEDYALGDIITIMAKAEPDPKAAYRKSTKATPKGKELSANPATGPLASPSPAIGTPSAPKRRKESSPAPSPAVVKAASPPPRRSSRQRSLQPSEPATSPKKRSRRTPAKEQTAMLGSEETVVEEDEEIASMAGPDMNQDIAEQKELIKKLKEAAEIVSMDTVMEAIDTTVAKRAREEEEAPLQFQFKEPENTERAIATNKRVGYINMKPQTKSVAWGIAAFAVGMGAMTLLPNFFVSRISCCLACFCYSILAVSRHNLVFVLACTLYDDCILHFRRYTLTVKATSIICLFSPTLQWLFSYLVTLIYCCFSFHLLLCTTSG